GLGLRLRRRPRGAGVVFGDQVGVDLVAVIRARRQRAARMENSGTLVFKNRSCKRLQPLGWRPKSLKPMVTMAHTIPYLHAAHAAGVIALWNAVFGPQTGHNAPALVIAKFCKRKQGAWCE